MSARDKLRAYFEMNVGRIITTQELSKIGGISEYARRIRELRDDEGMQISSHNDDPSLKPGEYILRDLKRIPKMGRDITPQLRNQILERNGYTCQLCGAGPGDADPCNPERKVRLHIDHVLPKSQGGTDEPVNLRVLCSVCNQTRANIETPSESALNILARLRRAPKSVRQEVYEALKRSFDP